MSSHLLLMSLAVLVACTGACDATCHNSRDCALDELCSPDGRCVAHTVPPGEGEGEGEGDAAGEGEGDAAGEGEGEGEGEGDVPDFGAPCGGTSANRMCLEGRLVEFVELNARRVSPVENCYTGTVTTVGEDLIDFCMPSHVGVFTCQDDGFMQLADSTTPSVQFLSDSTDVPVQGSCTVFVTSVPDANGAGLYSGRFTGVLPAFQDPANVRHVTDGSFSDAF